MDKAHLKKFEENIFEEKYECECEYVHGKDPGGQLEISANCSAGVLTAGSPCLAPVQEQEQEKEQELE